MVFKSSKLCISYIRNNSNKLTLRFLAVLFPLHTRVTQRKARYIGTIYDYTTSIQKCSKYSFKLHFLQLLFASSFKILL